MARSKGTPSRTKIPAETAARVTEELQAAMETAAKIQQKWTAEYPWAWAERLPAVREQVAAEQAVRDKLHALVEMSDPRGRPLRTYAALDSLAFSQLLETRQNMLGEVKGLLEELSALYRTAAEQAKSLVEGTPPTAEGDNSLHYRFPAMIPQHTFMEIKAAMQAFADAPTMRNYSPIEGEIAFRHKASDDAVIETKLIGSPMLNWLGLPMTLQSLEAELRQAGIPAALTLNICVGAAIEEYEVTANLDDLITAIGLDPRSRKERYSLRQKVWRWLLMCEASEVVGCRPGLYKDPATRQVLDLQSYDPLIRITGRRLPEQRAFDHSAPPIDVTFVAGAWVSQFRQRPDVLQYIGNVRRLAAVPAGKTSGAWAQAIGLTLNQLWRERAARGVDVHRNGEDNHLALHFARPFTRRQLLTLFPPRPTVWEILNGPNPKRAQTYWREAITKFLQAGRHISYYKELAPLQAGRKEWGEAWLDQPLDIRPPGPIAKDVAAIATEAKAARRARTQKRIKRAKLETN